MARSRSGGRQPTAGQGPAAEENTVTRNIYFYEIRPEIQDPSHPPPAVDIRRTLHHIEALPFTAEGRYWDDRSGKVLCCWPDHYFRHPRARLGTIRRSGFPQVELNGDLSALTIPGAAGLVEQIHMVFFLEGQTIFVGSEFNFYGPRVPGLKHYLMERAHQVCPPVTIRPLFRRDIVERLARLEDIRLFDLALQAPSSLHSDRIEALPFFDALQATAKQAEAEEIEVILRPRRYSRTEKLSKKLLSWLKSLVGGNEVPGQIARCVVKGLDAETGEIESVDVLKTQFIVQREIVREDAASRALNAVSAYAAIEQSYNGLHDQLLEAAGVQL
jgi:hypothetical protein